MAEPKHYAIYMVHRRAEHDYREWVIMPTTDRMPVNVWTRYINHEGARPTWRGTKYSPRADFETRAQCSRTALGTVTSTLSGHYRQNERNPGGRQWTWEKPVVVEVTAEDVIKYWNKTPYPVLNRVKRVLQSRSLGAGYQGTVEQMLARLAELLVPVS